MAGTSSTPYMDTVVTTTANTPYCLQTLLAALPAARVPQQITNPSGIVRAAYIQILADPAASQVKFYIGMSSSMSTTAWTGWAGAPGDSWNPPSLGFNMYRLDQIFLMADGSSARWYVNFVTR